MPGWTSGVFLGLGSNIEPREAYIRGALRELGERADCEILRISSLIETAPQGGPAGQGLFLNAVAELCTTLSPIVLLAVLLETEARHGRVRDQRNGPRTLDLDLLLFGTLTLRSPELELPHPRMWARSFVMIPLREICASDRLASIRDGIAAADAATFPVS